MLRSLSPTPFPKQLPVNLVPQTAQAQLRCFQSRLCDFWLCTLHTKQEGMLHRQAGPLHLRQVHHYQVPLAAPLIQDWNDGGWCYWECDRWWGVVAVVMSGKCIKGPTCKKRPHGGEVARLGR